ncbi:MAG TPA: hypothetical protein VFQ13_04575 [Anaerolineales bacterium]|nr:hypothetical protein [Anaerolineales bacterium]
MTKDSNLRETLLAELEFHRVEYTALKDEIAKWNEAERQFLNLSILAAGAGIGFTQVVGGQQIQIILLLTPLVFHVFFREMLDCTRHVTDISRYLIESLVPRVNTILDILDKDKTRSKALWYEYYSASDPINLLFFIIQPMRYWIPVSAIIALLLVYWSNAITNDYPIPPLHIFLIGLNIIYLLAAISKSAKSYRDFKLNSERIRKQVDKSKRESD